MEQQIHQAVEIALSATSSQELKNQAIEFVNQIKSTEEGYKSCLDILSKSPAQPINESLKFFIYQVLDENVDKLNEQQLFDLNTKVFEVLMAYLSNNVSDPTYLRNKFASIFGKLFCYVYTSIYPAFFKDLFNLINPPTQLSIDYYTRIVIAIHYEIGDKFISRTKEIQERNNLLKDSIRANDMNELVSSWFKILQTPTNSDEILNNALIIIGQFINWMEISLFVSGECVSTVLQYLDKPEQRNETCSTIIEIISKKMKPANKLELLNLFNLTSIIGNINLRDEDDIEFLENVSKLLNQIGGELLIILETDATLVSQVNEQFFKLWPLIFEFLGHEYDDISQQVFPFIQQYLLLSKKVNDLNSPELISTLLNKIILKMKFDDDTDGLNDEENEQFNEIRSRLKVFQETISNLNPSLYVKVLPMIIEESLRSISDEKMDWRKLELGLFELNNYSDSLRNGFLGKAEVAEQNELLLQLLVNLINSDFIVQVDHPKIQIDFFEIIVRNISLLLKLTNSGPGPNPVIIKLINIFTSQIGLLNQVEKVRLRSWYLFFRFIKLTKPTLTDEAFIESILIKLQPLLVIKAELPVKDEDDNLIEEENFSNQLYLFESIGLLISLIPNDLLNSKLKLIDLIFQPLFSNLEACIKNSDHHNQPLITLQVHHSLMAIGTFVRGFEDSSQIHDEVINKINNASQVVVISLENFPKSEIIREAARFSFSRFIPVLKNRIGVHLTKLITLILAAPNLKLTELCDFLSFLGQIVHNFKSDDNIYQLINNLISPLFNKVFDMLASNDDELFPDLKREKVLLKKAMMNFLSSIIINHVTSLLVTETNKQKFPTILSSLFEYAYDLSETSVSKLAITQLINIVTIFGNGDKINDPNDKYSESLPPLEGINEFLTDKVTQLSFELPFKYQEFDLKDAQYRLIAQELALLLKTYQQVGGDTYLTFLSNYLVNMGLSQELMNDFGSNLVKSDSRGFKKYFIEFVTQLKAR
ncbi:Xpo1-domain-containing protein [Suhomyces tanzawaensis NRRL Y-17324]|uniref:Exportin-T n=1 Tax=Suhomyces tanzawaensis NRRL Y-17324 TaxID=984487 RepID=A0A1E4SRD6_9ASCO|nr:Xpo1-domain-containing protein [Suhomyces tanzawaensis NRRL Y-17324]ODV82064.1 Xpo1-domain-containing protein [Suhomyces tanzawaensis NRRL Y-17324]